MKLKESGWRGREDDKMEKERAISSGWEMFEIDIYPHIILTQSPVTHFPRNNSQRFIFGSNQ